MKNGFKTITIAELIKELKKIPKETKVFVGSNCEGNSFSTLNAKWLLQSTCDGSAVAIMPYVEHIDWDEIDPAFKEKMDKLIKIFT